MNCFTYCFWTIERIMFFSLSFSMHFQANGNVACVKLTKDEIIVTHPDTGKKNEFLFDAVFGPDTTQALVFKDTKRVCFMQSLFYKRL